MKSKFKIGIVLHSLQQQDSICDLMQWLESNPNISIEYFLVKKNIESIPGFLFNSLKAIKNFSWKCLTLIEKTYYKKSFNSSSSSIFTPQNIHILDDCLLRSNSFISSDIFEELRRKDIDLFFQLTSDSRVSNICDASKYGILSIYGLSASKNKEKYPLAFDEVLSKSDKTGFSLIHQEPQTLDLKIIYEAAFPTHNYFYANKENLLNRRNFYIKQNISFFIDNKFFQNNFMHLLSLDDIPEAPNISDQYKYLIIIMYRFFIKALKKIFFKQSQWSVGFFHSDWRNLQFSSANVIANPDNCYLADPFIFSQNERDYCFLEEYSFDNKLGAICVYDLTDSKPVRLGYAIQESFHMSFPYIFTFKDKIYMVPETSANNDIRIYESIQFPLKWKLKNILMKDIFAVDSMIFLYDEIWWLFTNINPDNGTDACSDLSIFSSSNPLSNQWRPHIMNPVIVDSSRARNGGILFDDKNIYRVSQKQKFDMYGGEFMINKIKTLNSEKYSESIEYSMPPDLLIDFKAAHHCHSNGKITVFDFLK
tara:strand:+ start:148 stop:1755 length:1608 start_codon:yes stop_codon:yes gene_type:complete